MKNNKSLYIHIPFCNSFCDYCDFTKTFYNSTLATQYINKIISQLDNYKYNTIYIGGGSPSSLEYNLLELLLKNVSKNLRKNGEFSIEINPNDMDKNKFDLFKKYKVNRVSIGVQTFNEKLLKSINRTHNNKQVFDSINYLREIGINNISCDLMYGIPNQREEDVINDLNILIDLKIPHISTYALLIEPHTKFYINNVKALDDDIVANYYDIIRKILKDNNYIHYEISNFSLPSYQSRHNLVYWRGLEYKGLGAGASGYEESIRYTYTSSIINYINKTNIIDSSYISESEKEYEYIILNLRTNTGINLDEFKEKFNNDFLIKYKDVINELIKFNDITITSTNVFVNEDKYFILNKILEKF